MYSHYSQSIAVLCSEAVKDTKLMSPFLKKTDEGCQLL